MKRTKILLITLLFVMLSLLFGCNQEQESKTTLKAIPVAASTSEPKIIDSYTDGVANYYLIDVGYIKNTYISTIASAHYNGVTPVNTVVTKVTENTITESMTETTINCIKISNTQNHSVGIQSSWSKTFPIAGKFSVKLDYKWTGSWTNSSTTTKSQETSLEVTTTAINSVTTSIVIGEHSEEAGHYRYAMYAICDIYFIVSTSRNEKQLLSWDTIACARESTYFAHMDFSPDGNFDNSPDGNEIIFNEDFYKGLPEPTNLSHGDKFNIKKTDMVEIRSSTYKITDSGRFNQRFDEINFDKFDSNLEAMKEQGYKTISFYFELTVKENDDGYQWLFLFSSANKSNDYLISKLEFEHSPGTKDKNWWTHYKGELKFENIPIEKFFNNNFIIRYGASGDWGDTWENKDLKVQLVFKK